VADVELDDDSALEVTGTITAVNKKATNTAKKRHWLTRICCCCCAGKIERTLAIRAYVDATTKLAADILQKRTLGMTPGDYGTMFTEEIRASGAVEELLAGIFPDGKRIESADEIHEVTETFFDEWQVQTPVLFAEMLLWDLKCVVMKAAQKIPSDGEPIEDSMTVDEAFKVVQDTAKKDAAEATIEAGHEIKQTKTTEFLADTATHVAVSILEGKIKKTAKKITDAIRKVFAKEKDNILNLMVDVLDPQHTGKLDGATFSNLFLFDNAQHLAVRLNPLDGVVNSIKAPLDSLTKALGNVPEQYSKPIITGMDQITSLLEEVLHKAKQSSTKLLAEFTFPVAMASPFMPPYPRHAFEFPAQLEGFDIDQLKKEFGKQAAIVSQLKGKVLDLEKQLEKQAAAATDSDAISDRVKELEAELEKQKEAAAGAVSGGKV